MEVYFSYDMTGVAYARALNSIYEEASAHGYSDYHDYGVIAEICEKIQNRVYESETGAWCLGVVRKSLVDIIKALENNIDMDEWWQSHFFERLKNEDDIIKALSFDGAAGTCCREFQFYKIGRGSDERFLLFAIDTYY